MTYDEAYPWQIGDAVQYSGSCYYPDYLILNKSYAYYSVINRVETTDSVKIYFDIVTSADYASGPNPGGLYNISISNPFVYKKGDNISEYPSESMPYVKPYSYTDSVDLCGMREQLSLEGDFTYYCDSCQCLLPSDGFGSTVTTERYNAGLGFVYSKKTTYGPLGTGVQRHASLIYSNIGGQECGQIKYIGTDEYDDLGIRVFPNPTSESFDLNIPFEPTKIQLLDMSGDLQTVVFSYKKKQIIDVSSLSSGVYILQISDNRRSANIKIVIQ